MSRLKATMFHSLKVSFSGRLLSNSTKLCSSLDKGVAKNIEKNLMKSALLHLLFDVSNYKGSIQCTRIIIVYSMDIIFALLSVMVKDTSSCYYFLFVVLILDFAISGNFFSVITLLIHTYNLYFTIMPRCCRGKSEADQG